MLAPQTYLPFKIAIAASALAFAGSLYGFVQTGIVSRQTETVSFSLTLSEVENVPQGVFFYGSATTFAPLRSAAVPLAINQAHPHFQPVYTSSDNNQLGSGREIQRLLQGDISFAESSRPLQNFEEEEAQRQGFELKQIAVAWDGIAFYVQPQLAISGLTLAQIRDIFTGKVKNWAELGGPDLPITPYSLPPQTSGTAAVLQQVLAVDQLSANVKIVQTTTRSIRQVAQTPGGIGYATASEVVGQQTVQTLPLAGEDGFVSPATAEGEVNTDAFADGSYPLTRKLYIITRRDGSVDERAGMAYANLLLSTQGQRLIEQAGFAPISTKR